MRAKRDRKKSATRAEAPPEGEPQRLQKLLAARGFGSRREIEGWILEGRITVDGKAAGIGQKASGRELICLDGRALECRESTRTRTRIIAYNKPEGEVVSRSDPRFSTTVFDRLPRLREARWIAVGRLDVNSQGLLLLTTDGELAFRLTHPSYAVEREYAVRVLGEARDDVMAELLRGVELEDGPAKFDHVELVGGEGVNHWYRVSLREGRHREVRRLWEAVGIRVSRLIRIRYGNVTLPRDLRSGKHRALEPATQDELYSLVRMNPPAAAPFKRPPRGGRGKGRAAARQVRKR